MQELLSLLHLNPFYELSFILLLAIIIGTLGQYFKQPLIVTYILLGILVGPSFLNVIQSQDTIHLLADIGIAILLFIVGLKLDLRLIKATGKIAAITGIGQIIFTSLIGFGIAKLLNFTNIESFYIAVALTFSSTIIIVKLLSDKKELDTLHGQISIGFLIVQDIAVILTMIILTGLSNQNSLNLTANLTNIFLAIGTLTIITLIASKTIFPKLSKFLAKSPELLILFATTWAISLTAFSEIIGFSGEVGAFMAGATLATSQFKNNISNRLVSLRDFLLLFFFIKLGLDINLQSLNTQILPAIIFSLFVLIGNPLIVMAIMGSLKYSKKTSFLSGLTVAQISEFSLIFAGMGLALNHISSEIVGVITLVGLITIGVSTYFILYSHQIYAKIQNYLNIFQHKSANQKQQIASHPSSEILILGTGRLGHSLLTILEQQNKHTYLAIDFDPETITFHKKLNRHILHGDLNDPDFFNHIDLTKTKYIISTITDLDTSFQILESLKNFKNKSKIYLTAHSHQAELLIKHHHYKNILIPHKLAAENFYQQLFTTPA